MAERGKPKTATRSHMKNTDAHHVIKTQSETATWCNSLENPPLINEPRDEEERALCSFNLKESLSPSSPPPPHMDVSGTVLRQVTYVSGAGTNAHSRGARVWAARPTERVVMGSCFSDEGHLQYYQDKKKGKPVVLTAKNKLKLLKRVSKDMSLFDELGFALDPNQRALLNDLQGNLTSDSGEGLLNELEKLRAEEKKLKRKRKEEKKAKLKASKMKTGPDCESSSSSSSESSESSDNECDEAVDMNTFRAGVAVAPAPPPALPPSGPAALLPETIAGGDVSIGSVSVGLKNENHGVSTAPQKRIEVCMGNN